MKILYRLIFGETPRYCPIFLRGMTRAPTPILQAAKLAFWFFITILSKGFLLSLPYSLCTKPSILASVTIDLSPGKPLHCFCGGVSPPARRPGRGDGSQENAPAKNDRWSVFFWSLSQSCGVQLFFTQSFYPHDIIHNCLKISNRRKSYSRMHQHIPHKMPEQCSIRFFHLIKSLRIKPIQLYKCSRLRPVQLPHGCEYCFGTIGAYKHPGTIWHGERICQAVKITLHDQRLQHMIPGRLLGNGEALVFWQFARIQFIAICRAHCHCTACFHRCTAPRLVVRTCGHMGRHCLRRINERSSILNSQPLNSL